MVPIIRIQLVPDLLNSANRCACGALPTIDLRSYAVSFSPAFKASVFPLVFDDVTHVRRRRTQTATIVLSLATLVLFTSTTTFVIVTFINNEALFLNDFLWSAVNVWIYDPSTVYADFNSQRSESVRQFIKDYTSLYQCTGTAALMINVCFFPLYFCPAFDFAHSERSPQ